MTQPKTTASAQKAVPVSSLAVEVKHSTPGVHAVSNLRFNASTSLDHSTRATSIPKTKTSRHAKAPAVSIRVHTCLKRSCCLQPSLSQGNRDTKVILIDSN